MMLANIGLSDGIGVDDLFYMAGGIATIGAAYAVLARPIITRLRTMLGWWEKFARDWDGEQSEPGRGAVPGVMERLNRIDGELQRNGGSSMKDQIFQTRRAVDRLTTQIEVIEGRQREIRDLTVSTAERLDAHLRDASPPDQQRI